MKKRLLSMLLTLVMIVGVMPGLALTAWADYTHEAVWGTDADNLTQTGTLDEAIAAANAEGSTVGYIQLQKDVVLPFDEAFIFGESTTALTFDFNGCTVYGCMEWDSSTIFDIYRDITLRDTSDNPGGIHASTGSPFAAKKHLTVEGGVYEGSCCSFADYCPSAEIRGGTFQTTDGSAFQATGDTLTVSGGTFQSDGGPALYARGVETLTVSGGTFQSDGAYTVECNDIGEVTVSGGTIYRGSSSAIRIDDSDDKEAILILSGTAAILDTTAESYSDIVLAYANPASTFDMSGWEGAAITVKTSDYDMSTSNIMVPDDWGIFDSYNVPASTLSYTDVYTIKPYTVIFYDNSVSGWRYVFAAFTFDETTQYKQGTRIGESSVYSFTIPYAVNDIYFTNYQTGMPEEFYPEGIRRTVDFTLEANKTYEYVPEETDDEDSSVLQMIMDMMKLRFPSTAIVSGGGNVTADRSFVGYDQDITYTITPDEGYVIADVLVNGKSVGAVSEYTFKNVRRQHTIEVIFEENGWQNPFTDVTEADWFYEDIQFVSENGLMDGVGSDLFSPELSVNRAMIVTILWRLEGSPVVNYLMQFEDVPQDEWYSEAVRWAASEGIVLGYGDDTFGPLYDITHEQIAAVLQRYAVYKGWDDGLTFPMIPQYTYSTWAENHVIWADRIGLYDSIGSDISDLTTGTDRAVLAAYLRRFCTAYTAE